jgi:uncharacterized protein
MKRFSVIFMLLGIALLSGVSFAQVTPQPMSAEVTVQDFTIDLGEDFVTQAQFTYPADGVAPFPTVILFHGSGPYDMDATHTDLEGEVLSTNFRLLAEEFAKNGIATLRFNKRGVNDFGDYDNEQIQISTLDRIIADAEVVLNTATTLPEVDPAQIYLYGWSEGAWVVSNLATTHADELAGVILQGAPTGDLVSVLTYQQKELMLPYLTEVIDANQDGLLMLDEITTIPLGPVQFSAQFYLYEPSSQDDPQLNSFVNADGDDAIDIVNELEPLVETYLGNLPNFMPTVEASYDTATLLQTSGIPALLVHGQLDGWVQVSESETIAETNPETVTLMIYPELGHALSIVEQPATDSFGIMEAQPIADIVAWILGN